MVKQANDWIVVFRVKFAAVLDAQETQFTPPETVDIWRFGPENVALDQLGLPIFTSQCWGGFALYHDLETAKHHAANPLSIIDTELETIETWSALLKPIRHTGAVNWRGKIETGSAICAADEHTEEPIAVITSAGFISQEPEELPRIKRFTTGSKAVLEQFNETKGFLAGAILYSMFDGLDGITLTLWQDTQTMQAAAYQQGLHGDFMRNHHHDPMADRISNTRATIVSSTGSWNGRDPVT